MVNGTSFQFRKVTTGKNVKLLKCFHLDTSKGLLYGWFFSCLCIFSTRLRNYNPHTVETNASKPFAATSYSQQRDKVHVTFLFSIIIFIVIYRVFITITGHKCNSVYVGAIRLRSHFQMRETVSPADRIPITVVKLLPFW